MKQSMSEGTPAAEAVEKRQQPDRQRHTGRMAALLLPLLAAVCCGSCITPRLSVAADTDPAAWQQAAEVTIANDDTLARRDLDLFLRCNDRFGEDTLTVHITLLTPVPESALRGYGAKSLPLPECDGTHHAHGRAAR